MSIRKVQLKVGGVAAMPITSTTYTDTITINRAVETWSVLFTFTSADADPIVTVEGSNDGTTWSSAYNINTTLTGAFTNTSTGTNSLNAVRFSYNFMRIKIDNNSGTTGTMAGYINLGYDEQ